ncbi:MAG: hypothetical protein MZW92_30920 [Comamonadaceae bacterium]|nr:hypothetical protein [Comamonadaceae bacterium]
MAIFLYSFHEIANQAGAVLNMAKAVRLGGFVAVYEPKVEVSRRDMEKSGREVRIHGVRKGQGARKHVHEIRRY